MATFSPNTISRLVLFSVTFMKLNSITCSFILQLVINKSSLPYQRINAPENKRIKKKCINLRITGYINRIINSTRLHNRIDKLTTKPNPKYTSILPHTCRYTSLYCNSVVSSFLKLYSHCIKATTINNR